MEKNFDYIKLAHDPIVCLSCGKTMAYIDPITKQEYNLYEEYDVNDKDFMSRYKVNNICCRVALKASVKNLPIKSSSNVIIEGNRSFS
jgi:DNA-directed RNA polymerase subunit N (RpoN/RPB10)